jgi:hypothetical protein
MEILVERCAGLDVHKDLVVACVRVPGPDGERESKLPSFGTFTQDQGRRSSTTNPSVRESQGPHPFRIEQVAGVDDAWLRHRGPHFLQVDRAKFLPFRAHHERLGSVAG